jgi:predicted permease
MLRKSPGFTLVAVLSLAIGISANTTIFSAINAILLRPAPYPDSDRLVTIVNSPLKERDARRSVSPAEVLRWRQDSRLFEQIEATEWGVEANAMSGAGMPERVGVQPVTHGLFKLFGVTPILGQIQSEQVQGSNEYAYAVLSYEFWQRHFAGDPKVLGRRFFVDNNAAVVVAVLPRGFDLFGGRPADIYLLDSMNGYGASANERYLMGFGKLKAGTTIQQARSSMDVLARHYEQAYPDTNKGLGIKLQPLQEGLFGWSGQILYPLLAAVAFVLLIACTNVANLLLSRASARRKEIAIRTALGASRFRLIRQLLTESVFSAIAGGILGLLLSVWGVKIFVALAPQWLAKTSTISLDIRVLVFTLAISVVTGILFGLAPALRASKTDLSDSLKEGGRSSVPGSRHRMRSALVVTEVALALVLLICAGLMMNTVIRVLHADPGFHINHLLTLEVRLIGKKYFDVSQWEKTGLDLVTPQVGAFCRRVLEQVNALPGVQSAALIDWLPMLEEAQQMGAGFTIAGQPAVTEGERPEAIFSAISPNYFRVMRIPLLKGRELTEHDTETAPWVVVINQAMAHKYFPNQDPVGQVITLSIHAVKAEERPREIVGVVGDVRQFRLATDSFPEIYAPYPQQAQHCGAFATETRLHKSIVLRTSSETKGLTDSVRRTVAELDKDSPVFGFKTVQETVDNSAHLERFYTQLLGGFAVVALLLAAIGIYGVISYSVTERTHEIGLRMALGARSMQVLQLVLREGLVLSLAGVVIGLAASFAATPLIANFLYGVKAHDPMTLAAVSIFLIGITILATYIPARRATKVDPMVTLRHE